MVQTRWLLLASCCSVENVSASQPHRVAPLLRLGTQVHDTRRLITVTEKYSPRSSSQVAPSKEEQLKTQQIISFCCGFVFHKGLSGFSDTWGGGGTGNTCSTRCLVATSRLYAMGKRGQLYPSHCHVVRVEREINCKTATLPFCREEPEAVQRRQKVNRFITLKCSIQTMHTH